MKWITLEDETAAERSAAELIAERLADAVRERGRATLAISGGTTPWGMFERLAAQPVPWADVHILQVDERMVPVEHEARNWRRFLESSLVRRPPQANCHAMHVEVDDVERAADDYAALLTNLAGDPPVLDVVHLGIGDDGHTASLLPGDPVLGESSRRVGVTGPYQGHRRMTLTLPVLNDARCIVWLALGAKRRDVLQQLYDGDRGIPAGLVERDRAVCFTNMEITADS